MNDFSLAQYVGTILRIVVLILCGMPVIRWSSYLLMRFCTKRFSQHVGLLVGNIVFYGGLLFIGITLLQEFGFNVATLLGAAGVLGVAIGFASQASISNIISGFFLLLERPFVMGDIIKSGDVTGYVESVDLLSVRVRTLDNKLVRLPNEIMLKQHLTNLTFYPIKRIDCLLSMSYGDNVEQAQQLVHEVIARNSLFLTEPAPVVMVNKLAQHDYDTEIRTFLTVRVFVPTDKFRSAPGILMQQLKDQFDKNQRVITIVHTNN